jgi:hypothetical protein
MKKRMTNEELYSIIVRLSHKVESLENEVIKLKSLKSKNKRIDLLLLTEKPNNNLLEWIDFMDVKKDDISNIFEYDVVYAFKQCILSNIELIKNKKIHPFYKHSNDLFVYLKNNNEEYEWEIFDTTHLEIITKNIWLKFLKLYMQIQYILSDNQDIRDLQKKEIMGMRIKLYEVKKNRKELIKWFVNLF